MGNLRTGAASVGQFPERVERSLDVVGERDGIEGQQLLRERPLLRRGEDPGGERPLIRGLRGVVAFDDLAADTLLAEQLAHGSEDVELQAQEGVELLQRL